MPYLTSSAIERLVENPSLASTAGELNTAYSLCFLAIWRNNRQYATLDELQEYVYSPNLHPKTAQLTHDLLQAGISEKRLKRARRMAYREFMRRIGAVYENLKANSNGDIYEEEIAHLHEWVR